MRVTQASLFLQIESDLLPSSVRTSTKVGRDGKPEKLKSEH